MNESPVINIVVVPDEACPTCGAYWGNPDKSLDFPNRPKVGDEDGTWWFRCYNPVCRGRMYDPDTGRFTVRLDDFGSLNERGIRVEPVGPYVRRKDR